MHNNSASKGHSLSIQEFQAQETCALNALRNTVHIHIIADIGLRIYVALHTRLLTQLYTLSETFASYKAISVWWFALFAQSWLAKSWKMVYTICNIVKFKDSSWNLRTFMDTFRFKDF